MHYQTRAKKLLQRINELATLTEEAGMLTRTYGSAAFVKASKKVEQWMQEAGLQTSVDNIGNVRGRMRSSVKNAKTLLLASHIDSVMNAGKFDGPLGVLAAIDLAEQLAKKKRQLPFDVVVIAFCDEEGVRFHTTYLGSKVVAGSFEPQLLAKKDSDGITVQEALTLLGGTAALLQQDALAKEDVVGYFEIHIEQGPVLYEAGVPVAVVTAIAGQQRIALRFSGTAGHAGTVPMDMRQDALCCAAACVLSIEEFALAYKTELVATVGQLLIPHAASNVIPGEVTATLDIRSADESRLAVACHQIKALLTGICQSRHIALQWTVVQETKPVCCDAHLNNLLKNAITAAGCPVMELVSGAGHDAVPLAAIGPVAMLFVRCYKGISHNPLEDVEEKDLAAMLAVADEFCTQLILNHK